LLREGPNLPLKEKKADEGDGCKDLPVRKKGNRLRFERDARLAQGSQKPQSNGEKWDVQGRHGVKRINRQEPTDQNGGGEDQSEKEKPRHHGGKSTGEGKGGFQ